MKYIYRIAKISLSVFHFVLSCIGVGVIAFGCSTLRNLKKVEAGELHYEIPMALILVGMALVLFSFLGIASSYRASYWLSTFYSILLLAMFCCQIVLIGYVSQTKDALAADMKLVLHSQFSDKYEYGMNTESTPMDGIQSVFKCCGKRSYLDYADNEVPLSCCAHSDCIVKNIYKRGCDDQFAKFWLYQSEYMEYAGLFLALVELFGIVAALIVSRSYKKEIIVKAPLIDLHEATKIMAYD